MKIEYGSDCIQQPTYLQEMFHVLVAVMIKNFLYTCSMVSRNPTEKLSAYFILQQFVQKTDDMKEKRRLSEHKQRGIAKTERL